MRLPKMEDWQFYNRERLNELQSIEASLFDQQVEKGELPQSTRDLQLLTPELQEEKNRLLDEGFSAWSKPMHNAFLKASARFGRNEYDKIARELQQPLDEITRYATKFWTDGPTVFDDWDNKLKNIEKGEKKIEEIQRLTTATADLIKSFDNPWDDLHSRSNLGNAGRMYTSQEDRFLLCLTHLHGYGNWDQVRSSIRRCPAFRFDFFLQTCTSEQLGKRCETLMKAAERELEVLKKRNESSGGVKKIWAMLQCMD
jgi:SWI/SNF-related matrix-associated actin-dependent regulator of chromatin subfamily A member 5